MGVSGLEVRPFRLQRASSGLGLWTIIEAIGSWLRVQRLFLGRGMGCQETTATVPLSAMFEGEGRCPTRSAIRRRLVSLRSGSHGSTQAFILGFRYRARQLEESRKASPYLPASLVSIYGPVGRECWRQAA